MPDLAKDMDNLAAAEARWRAEPSSITMSRPSNWPLDANSERRVAPTLIRQGLRAHPLARDCFPLAVGLYTHAKGHAMQRDKHDDHLIIYCFGGLGYLQSEQWSGTVRKGELVMLPAGVAHRYQADVNEPWSIYWCHFSGELADQYMDILNYDPKTPSRRLEPNHAVISQFKALLSASNVGYNDVEMVYAANLLRQALTFFAALMRRSTDKKQGLDLNAVQAHMQSRLDESLSLEELADFAGLDKYQFSRLYKQVTGFSPMAHFMDMKAEYACYLLETSALSIKQIAHRVGYDDPLYFSRMFKSRRGLSPKAFRK